MALARTLSEHIARLQTREYELEEALHNLVELVESLDMLPDDPDTEFILDRAKAQLLDPQAVD